MALSRLNKLVGVRKFFSFSFEWILSSRLSHDWFTRVNPVRIIRKSDDGARFSIFGRTFQFYDPKFEFVMKLTVQYIIVPTAAPTIRDPSAEGTGLKGASYGKESYLVETLLSN